MLQPFLYRYLVAIMWNQDVANPISQGEILGSRENIFYINTSVIRKKGESQNGGNKKIRHAKFSEINESFLPPDTYIHSVFWKIWRALSSFYLPLENCVFALLPTNNSAQYHLSKCIIIKHFCISARIFSLEIA